MQFVDEACRQIFANDALPLALSSTKMCLIALQIADQAHANVLFEQLLRLL